MELGKGGMATLYLARLHGPEQFEKLLAIKRIHDHLSADQEFVEMFLDEARIAARIDHPNVATIFDLGSVDGGYYMAMEYVHGEDLRDLLKAAVLDSTKFPWTHAVRIVADAAAGLHAAHTLCDSKGRRLGIVHRDVSPQNILVGYNGHVKVVDFGVAFAAQKMVNTDVGVLKGKAGYMSPEQTEGGRVDHRSDVFALGIVLFEAVTIQRLFNEPSDAATLLRVRRADVPNPRSINPDIPEELEQVILKALARRPEDRFATARELSERLNAILMAQETLVPPQELSAMLNDFFRLRRRQKDQQILEAQQEECSSPSYQVEIETIEEPASSATGPKSRVELEPRGSVLRPLLIGAMAAVLLIAVAFAALIYGRQTGTAKETNDPRAVNLPSAKRDPAPVPAKTRPSPVSKDRVVLEVSVRPEKAGAVVLFRGHKYAGSKIRIVVARSSTGEKLRIEAEGYKPEDMVVVPTANTKLKVTLTPAARKPTRRKAARKPRKGRGKVKGRLFDPFG
jgi:serine/threonine-protein kinase